MQVRPEIPRAWPVAGHFGGLGPPPHPFAARDADHLRFRQCYRCARADRASLAHPLSPLIDSVASWPWRGETSISTFLCVSLTHSPSIGYMPFAFAHRNLPRLEGGILYLCIQN